VKKNGHLHTVWIVDSEQWPRACLRAEMIERGWDATGFARLGEALLALRQRRLAAPEIIVLESRGQQLTRRDLNTLLGSGIPVILLAGNLELNDPQILHASFADVLRRPLTLGAIAEAAQSIISAKCGSGHSGRAQTAR